MSLKHAIKKSEETFNESSLDHPRCCERHAAGMRIDKKGKSPVCSNSQTEVKISKSRKHETLLQMLTASVSAH